jgi:hypothetical protein
MVRIADTAGIGREWHIRTADSAALGRTLTKDIVYIARRAATSTAVDYINILVGCIGIRAGRRIRPLAQNTPAPRAL